MSDSGKFELNDDQLDNVVGGLQTFQVGYKPGDPCPDCGTELVADSIPNWSKCPGCGNEYVYSILKTYEPGDVCPVCGVGTLVDLGIGINQCRCPHCGMTSKAIEEWLRGRAYQCGYDNHQWR